MTERLQIQISSSYPRWGATGHRVCLLVGERVLLSISVEHSTNMDKLAKAVADAVAELRTVIDDR
jgi:hypothetical protein